MLCSVDTNQKILNLKNFNFSSPKKFTYAELGISGVKNIRSFMPKRLSYRSEGLYVSWEPRTAFIYMPYYICTNYLWVQRLSRDTFPGAITLVHFYSSDSVALTVKPEKLFMLLRFFRGNLLKPFDTLLDITVVDLPWRANRFELTYVLLNIAHNERLYLRTFVSERELVPSITDLYPSANWLEREAWDMFGIPFSGHPDLRRILTDYGFFGHPMRKDFPLTGFFEIRYDDTSRRVVSEALNLIQELRLFFFNTPWKPL